MKKLIVILMILIVGILACGCTSQPAAPAATTVPPTETAVPTAIPTPVITQIPTPVITTALPTTAVPTTTPTPTPTPLPDVNVKITSSHSISPSTVTVPAGTKVIFTTDSIGSTFQISIKSATSGNNVAQSGLISTKNSFSYTFKTAGIYQVSDIIAPNNGGIIIVK